MSKVCKRKHVVNEYMWDDCTLPEENQSIVKILKSPGNNLHTVTTPTGEEYMVSMPPKFRRNIWVKRGTFVLVEPITEGNKVKGEVVKILNKNSIKYYKDNNIWPKEFEDDKPQSTEVGDDGDFLGNKRLVDENNYCTDSESSTESSSDETESDSETENVKK